MFDRLITGCTMKQWTLRKVSWPIFWSSLAGVSDSLDFGNIKYYSEIIPAGVFW